MKPCTGNCHHAAQLEQRLAALQAANEAKDNIYITFETFEEENEHVSIS